MRASSNLLSLMCDRNASFAASGEFLRCHDLIAWLSASEEFLIHNLFLPVAISYLAACRRVRRACNSQPHRTQVEESEFVFLHEGHWISINPPNKRVCLPEMYLYPPIVLCPAHLRLRGFYPVNRGSLLRPLAR